MLLIRYKIISKLIELIFIAKQKKNNVFISNNNNCAIFYSEDIRFESKKINEKRKEKGMRLSPSESNLRLNE